MVSTGLGPGNYMVIVDATDCPDIPGGYFPSVNNIVVTLGVGEDRTDVDFPFAQLIGKQVDRTKADPGNTFDLYHHRQLSGQRAVDECGGDGHDPCRDDLCWLPRLHPPACPAGCTRWYGTWVATPRRCSGAAHRGGASVDRLVPAQMVIPGL